MLRRIIAVITCFCLILPSGEGIKCYHCFESYYNNGTLETIQGQVYGPTFVRCDKSQRKWNSWDCPAQWPVCIYMSGKVSGHYEKARSCGEKDFCSKYKPPATVTLDTCQECNTTLCNDHPRIPDPPVGPGPLFTFNINLNLNLKKYP